MSGQLGYVCVDCGQRFYWRPMRAHECPDPGSMKRLKASIAACIDCKLHPTGDYCPDHYDMARRHPFAKSNFPKRRGTAGGSGA